MIPDWHGARIVTQATGTAVSKTGKAVNSTARFAREAWNEIPTWHEVRNGETFKFIAQYYGVPSDELRILNPLTDPLNLKIGQRLRLRR